MSNEKPQVRGYIYKIFPTQNFKNDFQKREFVLETRETVKDKTYKNFIKLTAIKKDCAILDSVGVGSEIELTYIIDGREWKNPEGELKYFTDLRLWNFKVVNNTNQDIHNEPVATVEGEGQAPDDDIDLSGLPF